MRIGPNALNPLTVLLLVAAFLLAGCAGTPGGGPAASGSGNDPIILPPATPARANDDTCGLSGFVTDDSVVPIPGADVQIEGAEHRTKADADGKFSFSYLRPASYQLLASALEYESSTSQVTCEAGQKLDDLRFVLKPLPAPVGPYHKTLVLPGRFGCSVSFVVDTGDACSGTVPLAGDPGVGPAPAANQNIGFARTRFTVVPDADTRLTAALFEVKWQSQAAILGAAWLSMNYPGNLNASAQTSYCPTTEPTPDAGHEVRGQSLLCVKLVQKDAKTPLIAEVLDTTQLVVEMKPTSDVDIDTQTLTVRDRSSKVVVDQPFELRVTLFYDGDVPKDGFSGFA